MPCRIHAGCQQKKPSPPSDVRTSILHGSPRAKWPSFKVTQFLFDPVFKISLYCWNNYSRGMATRSRHKIANLRISKSTTKYQKMPRSSGYPGKQTEILHFCYMYMYSLELFLEFWKTYVFDKNLDWILMDWPSGGASPLRTTVCRLPGRGLFFPRITRPWNFKPHFGDFRICWIQKRRGISPEVGSTNFQPLMVDMDPFGGEKVPCTK